MAQTGPGRKQKNHSITEEVADKLEREKFGNQSLLVDNLLRRFYGMPPKDFDRLDEEIQDRFWSNIPPINPEKNPQTAFIIDRGGETQLIESRKPLNLIADEYDLTTPVVQNINPKAEE